MIENKNTSTLDQKFLIKNKRRKTFKDDGILFLGHWFGKFFSGSKEHDYDNDPRVTDFARDHSDNQEQEKQKRLIKASDKLLSKAWGVEIIAATIGVIVAIATGYSIWFDAVNIASDDGQSGLDTSTWINIFLGSLPFIMVAIVELAKIPLARVVYNATSLLLKTVFSIVLVGAIVITFETLATGFERSIAGQLAQISTDYAKLADRELLINTKTVSLSANTSGKQEESKDALDQNKVIKELYVQFDKILEGINGPEVVAIKNLEKSILDLKKQRDSELDSLIKSTESKNKNIETRRKEALSGVSELIVEIKRDRQDAKDEIKRITAKCDANPQFLCGSVDIPEQRKIITESDVKLAKYKEEKNLISSQFKLVIADEGAIRNKYQKKINKINNDIALKREGVENSAKNNPMIISKRAEITRAQKALTNTNEENRKSAKAIRANNRKLRKEIEDLQSELPIIKDRINKKAANINIYRLAYMTSPDPEISDSDLIEYHKVKPKWVMTVAEFWFGTLAFVVSIVGTLMAFGSFVLRDWHLQKITSPAEQISKAFYWIFHYPKQLLDLVLDTIKRVISLIVDFFRGIIDIFKAITSWLNRDRKIEYVDKPFKVYKDRAVFFPFLTDQVDMEIKSNIDGYEDIKTQEFKKNKDNGE